VSGTPDLTARCHCGAVRITLPRAPAELVRCNCSLCAKTRWLGIYFSSDELKIEGEFDSYVRTDIPEPMIRIMRCRNCGVPTHWEPLGEPPYERMGVNANLLDPSELGDLPVREVDGASW